MANPIREFDPVTHITAGAVGQPGHRVFFIQAEHGSERITLRCEKEQVRILADSIDEMIANLEAEFGLPAHRDLVVDANIMAIIEPVDPLFRVGSMALGFDASRDRILLVLQEDLNQEERDPIEVRLFATRAQMQILSAYAKDVVSKGRSPEQRALQAEAHVRRNGHDH